MGLKTYIQTAGMVLLMTLLAGCSGQAEKRLSGKTMGTTFHIKVVTGTFYDIEELRKNIEQRLKEINRSMSVFQKESEISRFNAISRADEKFAASKDFLEVLRVSRQLYDITQGAWDGTVKPILELWGFGNTSKKREIPPEAEIHRLLSRVGFHHIDISPDGALIKRQATVSLDLGSIAKGYGVDQVASVIRKSGIRDFLVEIGGEVFASGLRKDGTPWRVGVNRPAEDAGPAEVYSALTLTNQAMATSGDYRNFFTVGAVRYSHVIDPRTGHPVNNGVVSVSVIADSCTVADGLATAVMVMGHEKGLALAEKLNRVECMIVVREQDGRLVNYLTRGFQEKLIGCTMERRPGHEMC